MKYIVTRENNNDALMHYGVPGMRWRNRRAFAKNSGNVKTAKKNFKNLRRQRWRAENELNRYEINHPIAKFGFGATGKQADKMYNNINKIRSLENAAKSKYKNEKIKSRNEYDKRVSEYKDAKKQYKHANKQDRSAARANVEKAKSRLKNY